MQNQWFIIKKLQIIADKREVLLDVDSANVAAHPLYLSLGFKEIQVVDYFLIDLVKQDSHPLTIS